MSTAVDDALRELVPHVLGALVRRYGHFDAAEDAVQEALLAAATQWPEQGTPANPRAWLIRVASRRLIDELRSEQARRRREDDTAAMLPQDGLAAPAADADQPRTEDDTLTLLFMCCHPTLTAVSQLALTLRAVGGLTTAQIARAFLVPEATMAQRISRAKQSIKASGVPFQLPPEAERAERLRVVLHVLYLIFNEGHTATSGPDLHRAELTGEAIRLTRQVRRLLSRPAVLPGAGAGRNLSVPGQGPQQVRRLLPDDGEVAGLLALMLLTDARREARTRPDGTLVPLAEQDRSRWDQAQIQEGTALLTETLQHAPLGPYQLQAAIAAVHAEATRPEDTDWPQILALYELLMRSSDNPMVSLNHAVALAMVRGPRAGLDRLDALATDSRVAEHHRLAAVRAHLLEMAGDHDAARAAYQLAARRTTSLPEQRYLEAKAAGRAAQSH